MGFPRKSLAPVSPKVGLKEDFYHYYFIVGNNKTSRIVVVSVRSMQRRSIPTPSPPVGGIPYSSAST